MGAGMNPVAVLTTLIMQTTIGTVWYGPMFGGIFSKIVYGRRQVPENPLLPLLTTLASTSVLMLLVNYLAIQFGVSTWQQGIKLAAVLWVVDACLNIRHYMFEHRPFVLFLLHSGYHLVTLLMACGLLTAFGAESSDGRPLPANVELK